MDRMITATVNGMERQMNYSVSVMFDMVDKFGNLSAALETLDSETKESFQALQWFVVHMVNDAELCRRDLGYDHQPLIEEADVSMGMSPLEYAVLKSAVVDAITQGYVRETSDNKKEIDLGLEELRAKKARAGE